MKQKLYIPRINYIVFELVLINIDQYAQGEPAKQIETVYLAVIPEQFRFQKAARDAIVQTDDTIFMQKFPMQPERITIRGTFGDRPRLIAGTYMDGWSRLKQFEESVIDKSKESFEDGNYIYALNYYDFVWQKFGSVNIKNFDVSGNAKTNANLPTYSCEFLVIGDLLKVNGTDLILQGLTKLLGMDGLLQDGLDWVNVGFAAIEPGLNALGIAYEGLNTASQLIGEANSFIESSGLLDNQIHDNVTSLF